MKNKRLVILFFAMPFAMLAQTYTFTNAGAEGREGPTQAQIDANYSGTNLAGKVTINTRGIQEWTVPAGGIYRIIAFGAEIFSASAVNAYSRDSETDADVEGLKLMVDAEIDPTGMVEFFQIMEQEEDELTEMIPLWMRSHPEHEERIVVLQAQIGALPMKDYPPLDMDWDAVKAELGVEKEQVKEEKEKLAE